MDNAGLSIDQQRLEFEQRKWADEFALKQAEAHLKLRESSFWSRLFSPVTATVMAGILTVAGSVTATLIQNSYSISLERQKSENTQQLERRKQQHELILKMIGVDNVEQARTNVRFLAETKLISDEALAQRLLATKETPLIKPVQATPAVAGRGPTVRREDLRRLISDEAFDLLVSFEIGGLRSYDPHPRRLSANAGYTIGFGYDLGFATIEKFKEDWSPYLSQSDLEVLAAVVGKRGNELAAGLDQISQIEIDRDNAMAVFESTLASWANALERNLPNVRELPGDAYGALLSLAYNRGTAFKASGDRFVEMRAIYAAMDAKQYTEVPGQIRAMKRLWPQMQGLGFRRDREAALFEKGLAKLTPSGRE